MSIAHLDTITKSILELLRERHRVVIPDFGAFTGIYESSEVDRAEKTLSPPTLRIDFQRELRSNDGLLIAQLIEQHGWPPEEAEKRLAAFVEEAERRLARRQMIAFPGLGKLYIDFDKRYKFIQESDNLNKATFGLPEVSLTSLPTAQDMPSEANASGDNEKPIEANETASPPKQTSPKADKPSPANLRQTPSNSANQASWLNSSTPWIILMLLIILLVSGYFLWKKFTGKHNSTSPQTEETTAGSDNGLAQQPATADFDRLSPTDDELLFEDDAEDLADLQYEEEQSAEETTALQEEGEGMPSGADDSEAPTLPPDVQEGIIIIGSFTQPKNAERLIQRLYEDGYDAYSDRRGGRTRVGIRFTYSGEAELMDYLEQMKNKYNVDAWVLGE